MSDVQVTVTSVVKNWLNGQLIEINDQDSGLLEVIDVEIRYPVGNTEGVIFVRCHNTPWLAETEFKVYMGM